MSKFASLILIAILAVSLFLLDMVNTRVDNLKIEREFLLGQIANPMIEAAYDPQTGDVHIRVNGEEEPDRYFAQLCPRQGFGL